MKNLLLFKNTKNRFFNLRRQELIIRAFLFIFATVGVVRGDSNHSQVLVTHQGVCPSIASNPGGDFVVSWGKGTGEIAPGIPALAPFAIYARLFHEDGSPKGPEILVRKNVGSGCSLVKMDGDGNFIVFYRPISRSIGIVGIDNPIIAMRRYGADGVPLDRPRNIIYSQKLFSTYDVDMSLDGRFTVAWSESENIFGKSIVYAQNFSNDGSKLGPKIDVTSTNPEAFESHRQVSVGMADDGGFGVAWLHRIFSNRTAPETEIHLKIAVYNESGELQENHTAFSRNTSGGEDYLTPKITKISPKGFAVMSHLVVKSDPDQSRFELGYYPIGAQPTGMVAIPDFEVFGSSGFDLLMTPKGQLAVTIEVMENDHQYAVFGVYDSDLSQEKEFTILNPSGAIPTFPELQPVLTSRTDHTFAYAFTQLPEGFGKTAYYSVYAGVLTVKDSENLQSIHLNYQHILPDTFEISFDTQPERVYRILKGEAMDKLLPEQVINGDGSQVVRQYPIQTNQEFIAVYEE